MIRASALAALGLLTVVGAGCSRSAREVPPRPDEAVAARAAVDALLLDAATMPADGSMSVFDAAAPTAPTVSIIDAPMRWTDERARLTLDYRRAHSDGAAADLVIEPRVIVLHYTGGGSAKGTRGYFDNVRIEASRKELARAGAVNVSAHFVVDRDGTIYRLQPETRFARHCIGLNHLAIGIENVGDEAKWPLTDAQVAANVALVRDLVARFRITHLLGHHEVMAFRDHAYYVERDPGYRNSKSDPGNRFMGRVRAELADLQLAGLP
ncbi:MAG: N-acetylmuramoyl-L-alanine amidase [Deltaproteobacteria bacterium]|nr:N-acetylmuramoyl-L-alanine amidase [Deltaproteobacteria bacterium]